MRKHPNDRAEAPSEQARSCNLIETLPKANAVRLEVPLGRKRVTPTWRQTAQSYGQRGGD